MEIGKRTFEKIRSAYNSPVVIASPASFPAFTLRSSSGVAGRGWNKEKGNLKNPLVIGYCG
jgi:hypothetical protein